MKNQVIATYGSYNFRRYSAPWVCRMTDTGKYDFKHQIGTYTGDARKGEAGDLVGFEPEEGAVYGYGQKDYRKASNTEINHVKYLNGAFVQCDKLGRIREE